MPPETTSVTLYAIRLETTGAAMTDDTGGQIVERLQTILPWLGLLVVSITILAFVIGLILRLYNYYRKYNQEAVLLELTPPAFTNKAPLATSQLFSARLS